MAHQRLLAIGFKKVEAEQLFVMCLLVNHFGCCCCIYESSFSTASNPQKDCQVTQSPWFQLSKHEAVHRPNKDSEGVNGRLGAPGVMMLRGGFKNVYGTMLGEQGQCLNFSRGAADGPRFKHDPYSSRLNESEAVRTIDDMNAAEALERMTEESNWERAKHVVPRSFLTDKSWHKKLRACCICGLLKTQDMWLEYGCENCPFLIQPGLETKDRVEAVTTAIWRGMWAVMHDNITDSLIVKEKFPNGVHGTKSGAPIKGLYCVGFWRGLPNDVVQELKERDIDPSVRLWNRFSAESLNQEVPDREAGNAYSEDEAEDEDAEDTSLSGFIVDDESKVGDEYLNDAQEEGPDIEEIIESMQESSLISDQEIRQ